MRKKKLIKSVMTSYVKQLVYMLIGLILPRVYLEYYGSEVNGLVNSIAQFLGYISLLNMGLSSVISSSLYKPLSDNDDDELSRVIKASETFFKSIAKILLLYTIVLVVVYPFLIDNRFGFGYVALLIVVIVISLFGEYYFGMTWTILLNADQRPYVANIIQTVVVAVNFIICIMMIKIGCSIHVVKLVSSVIFIIKPLMLNLYVKKHYNINKSIELDGNPIKQSKNGIAQHIAFTIFKNADVAVLTIFSTLKTVSVYSVYYLVVDAILGIFQSVTGNMTAIFGDMISKKEHKKMAHYFEIYTLLLHVAVTIVFCVAGTMILSFVKLYTIKVTDINYEEPVFAIIMLFAYAIYIIRVPYNQMIQAAGHYKETQTSAWIEALLNVVISVVMVRRFGLVGVAVGTLLAMLYRLIYFVIYLSKNIINYKILNFVKMIVVDFISMLGIFAISRVIVVDVTSFFEWGVKAVFITLVYAFVTLTVNFVFYNRLMIDVFKMSRIRGSRKL